MNGRRPAAILVLAALAIGCSTASSGGPAAVGGTPPSSALPAGSATTIPAAIVGTWTTTMSEADLRAGGVTAPGELAENTGVFTMQLGSDGTWSTAQVSDTPVRWPVFKGTYEVTGPDSFRETTTFPADFAGDTVDFTWSLTDGALALRVQNPPDHILPIITETRPWQPKR